MTPEEFNDCKKELPPFDGKDEQEFSLKAAIWFGRWWRPLVIHVENCMHRHEQSIFPSTMWAGGDIHLRANHRNPGEIVVQLPIVVNRAELDILMRGLDEISSCLAAVERKP